MQLVIRGLKFRAVTEKLCDFLSDVGALLVTDGKTLDIVIESYGMLLEFKNDERDEIVVKVIRKGNRYAYTFESVDLDSVTFE